MLTSYKIRKAIGQQVQKARLRNKNFTLISNDCWGAEVYKFLGPIRYNTPFVGLWLHADDYLQLLTNPQYYLASRLEFVTHSRHDVVNQSRANNPFPIGVLAGQIEIQFLHYKSAEEAREKWEERVKRINWGAILVKWDASKDGATESHMQAFRELPFKKLVLLKDSQTTDNSAVVVPNYSPNGKDQFNLSMAAFDLVHWLNTGQVRQGAFYKLLNKLLVIEN